MTSPPVDIVHNPFTSSKRLSVPAAYRRPYPGHLPPPLFIPHKGIIPNPLCPVCVRSSHLGPEAIPSQCPAASRGWLDQRTPRLPRPIPASGRGPSASPAAIIVIWCEISHHALCPRPPARVIPGLPLKGGVRIRESSVGL